MMENCGHCINRCAPEFDKNIGEHFRKMPPLMQSKLVVVCVIVQIFFGAMNIFCLNNKLLFPPQQLVLVTVDIAVGRSWVSAADYRN